MNNLLKNVVADALIKAIKNEGPMDEWPPRCVALFYEPVRPKNYIPVEKELIQK